MKQKQRKHFISVRDSLELTEIISYSLEIKKKLVFIERIMESKKSNGLYFF